VAKKGVLVAQGVYRLASGRVEFTEIGTLGATAPADSEGTTVSRREEGGRRSEEEG